jgi:hypothetical protein
VHLASSKCLFCLHQKNSLKAQPSTAPCSQTNKTTFRHKFTAQTHELPSLAKLFQAFSSLLMTDIAGIAPIVPGLGEYQDL